MSINSDGERAVGDSESLLGEVFRACLVAKGGFLNDNNEQRCNGEKENHLNSCAIAHIARRRIWESLRSRDRLLVKAIVGGMDVGDDEGGEERERVPKIHYLDDTGSKVSNVPFACHGLGSNFLLGHLDVKWEEGMSEREGVALVKSCFEELRERFVLNNKNNVDLFCIDKDGVRRIALDNSNTVVK